MVKLNSSKGNEMEYTNKQINKKTPTKPQFPNKKRGKWGKIKDDRLKPKNIPHHYIKCKIQSTLQLNLDLKEDPTQYYL